MKSIYLLIEWMNLESPIDFKAFHNKKLLDKYMKDNDIQFGLSKEGKGFTFDRIEYVEELK